MLTGIEHRNRGIQVKNLAFSPKTQVVSNFKIPE